MVRKVLAFMHTEIVNIHHAAYLLGVFAFGSQLLGLVRDRMLAHHFGASSMLDVYYAAFRIPDMVYIVIASLVSISVLVPFLSESFTRDAQSGGNEQTRALLSSVTTMFFGLIILVSLALLLVMPTLASIVAPGFTGEDRELFILLSRILLLSPVILGFSNVLGSITQSKQKFFVYAVAPMLYNFGIIIGILFFLPIWGMTGVVVGVLCGSLFHALIQVPTIRREGLFPRLTLKPNVDILKRITALSIPRSLALASTQFVFLVLVALATTLSEGSVTVLSFSFNIQSVPLSIIGVSYSVAAFPALARFASKGEGKRFAEHMALAARHIILWSMPAIMLFIVLRAQIVRVVLGSGSFDWTDTRLTAAALAAYVVSVVAQALQLLFVRGYYAAGKTTMPLVINVVSAVVIIAAAFSGLHLFSTYPDFRLFLEAVFRIEGLPGTDIVVLPLAYSLGMIVNVVLLWCFFNRDFHAFSLKMERAFAEMLVGSFVMGLVAYGMLGVVEPSVDTDTFIGIFLQGAISGFAGIFAGAAVLFLIGNKEIRELATAIGTRTGMVRPVASEQREL
ncbi:MAG: murein biosynthesis integral membrane protein MurJ [Parcubacteria group bacterium]|nr:murein biosynthesis integral membrane protein MurJ [Parcubacteria group bacterium]